MICSATLIFLAAFVEFALNCMAHAQESKSKLIDQWIHKLDSKLVDKLLDQGLKMSFNSLLHSPNRPCSFQQSVMRRPVTVKRHSAVAGAVQRSRCRSFHGAVLARADAKGETSTSREERLTLETASCQKMGVSDLRKELQALGIPTLAFVEKSDFVNALAEARVEGRVPQTTSTTTPSAAKLLYDKRLADEISNCKSLPLRLLRKELEGFGLTREDTKAFAEKDEFVKKLAELRASGAPTITRKSYTPPSTTSTTTTTATIPRSEEAQTRQFDNPFGYWPKEWYDKDAARKTR